MVFESIVTDLMNRFLGDFIENLDKKQLNIGIWGGDVVLKNLQLKQSALKELDLPVQTIYGCLGKLVLKIPWKNLYSLPVVADIEDLYLLVAPNAAVPYDADKHSPILQEYHMNNKPIKRVQITKDIGVTYDQKFSFKYHTEIALNKATSMLSFVKRQCYGRFNAHTAKMLYSAVVRSHLEFASSIWAPHHNVHIQSLESVQRQFVLYANQNRYVDENQDGYRLRPYLERCDEMNLQSLLRRRTNSAVYFIHDILTGRINSQFIRDKIELHDGSRTLRSASMIRLKPGPDYIRFSPLNYACRLFNLATNHVDPTIPSREFRSKTIKLISINQMKADWETKKGELVKFDEAKKRELDKDKPIADKSFTEKLVAQIINNVQIHIKNVHIRYEDRSTSSIPFSMGITLGNLEVHTTDADWQKAFLSEALSKVFKVAKMDGLAVYMNCNSTLFQSSSTSEYNGLFTKTIATKDVVPENFTYILGPINSMAKLKLNMEPQLDGFQSPKIDLFLEMEKLAVGITKAQYQNLIGLADGMSAMSRGVPYRQYRPHNTPYHKNAKVWWHFAYQCVLETEVKRRKRNWSWSYMFEQIQLNKEYAKAYRAKTIAIKVSAAQIQSCEDLERKMNLFNILFIRKRVDMEVKISDKQKAEVPKPSSWFGGWFGGGKEDTSSKETDDILDQFKTAMTPAEKAKLFEAIGYTEGVTDELPLDYVAISMEFKLNLLEVCVRNESLVVDSLSTSSFNSQTVLSLQVQGVKCGIDQRPASSGLKVDLNLKEFTVYGHKQVDHLPVLVKSKIGELVDVSLLNVKFEMNPLDKLCDQRVNVSARPLEIVYDAETIIQLVQTFKLPTNTNLSELTDAAADKISNIKERSATGIQYMVEKHTRLEVNISVMPNYVLIPFGGKYLPDKVQVMVISLGKISLTSVPTSDRKDISMMYSLQFTSEDIMKEVLEQAYDRFRLDIENIQILLAKPSDDWKEVLLSGKVSQMHILEPIAMNVSADLCVVDDDPRLPKTRISSKFPHIRLSVTEDNVLEALALVTSIPLPENEDVKPMPLNKESGLVASSRSFKRYLDEKQLRKPKKPEIKNSDLSQEIIQYTDLEFSFVMNELSVNIYKSNKRDIDSTPTSQYRTPTEEFLNESLDQQSISVISNRYSAMESMLYESNQELKLSFQIKQLEMGLTQRTYDMKVSLKLGAIAMDEYQCSDGNAKIIRMIETPSYGDLSGYLFSLQYTNANKTSPEFTTKYKSTEQLVEINFSVLILRLHQEGLTELLQISNNFQTKLDKVLNVPGKDRIANAGPLPNVMATIAEEPAAVTTSSRVSRNVASLVDSIKMKVIAKMERVGILLENERRLIADLKIENLTAGVVMKTSYTEVSVKLQDILITDMNPETIHPTIISVIGGNAIACQIVLYNLVETSVYNSDDMKIDVSMGCVKIIFLNWFVNSVLSFLDNFQAAQKAIADASAAAAETAKQNMVNAYANATRMRLNIKIKAPIIIVPVDSQSLDAISIDLGLLSITNNCSEIPGSRTTDAGSAILDEMKLELTDMKICKVEVCKTQDTSFDSPTQESVLESDSVYGIKKANDSLNMLNPTSFVLIIKRNLSSGWYKEIPELDISGRLKSIVLNLMQSDYKMLLQIVSRNMSEGSSERTGIVQPVTPVKTPSNSASTTTNAQLHVLTDAEKSGPNDDREPSTWDTLSRKSLDTKPFGLDISKVRSPTQAVHTFLNFAFQMDSIILNLYTDENEGLASFGIHFLSLKGTKLVDESLSASVILCDVQLDDTRPDRQNHITKFMKKRETSVHSHDDDTKPDSSMVDIVARITQHEMFLNLKVSSFDLILCLEYLMKILQFVSVPEDESVSKPITEDENASKPISVGQSATSASKKIVAEATDLPKIPSKQITVLLRVDQPDIILVEKMDDINCLALILNTQIELRLRIQDDKQIVKGDISDLKFYICEFNPSRREATKHFILQPCQIALQGNTPEEKGMHISLTTSDIRVNISPAIIELLNKTLTTLTENEDKNDKTLAELPDYSDLWGAKPYKDSDYWFMKIDNAEDVLLLDPLSVKAHLPEVCIVEVPSIVLVIEIGLGYYTYPMLVIETKMNAEVKDWSSELSIASSMTLGMAYYNSSLAVWEPIIEPNEREKSNGLTEYGPWELNFNLKIEKSFDDNSEQIEPKTKILVSSSDTLEMSVTKTCLDVLTDLGNAFSQAIRPEGLHKPDVIAPYIVENDTGFDITLNLKRGAFFLHASHLPNSGSASDDFLRNGVVFQSTLSSGNELTPQEVTTCKISPGGKAYLQGKKEDLMNAISAFSSLNKDSQNVMFLHVQIGDIGKDVTLPIHKADRRYFPLYRDTKQEPWGIISNVKTEYGSTVITISGVLRIQNHFSTTVNIFRIRDGIFHDIGQVAPGASFNVPLHALYAQHKELYFSIAGYKTSVQGINWKDCPSDFKYTKYLQCDPMETFEPFYITAIRERQEVYYEVTSKVTMLSTCYVIHLKPPLYLRNALPIDISISVAGCSVANTDDVTEAQEVSQVDGTPVKKNFALELSPRDDFLDYGEKVVKPGDVLHLPTVKTTVKEGVNKSYIVARLIQYLEKDWSCTTEIPSDPAEFAVWTFSSYDSVDKMTIDLGVKFENRHGSLQLTIYCPYWMINKTGLMLSYRASDENVNVLYHPPELEGPILFSFREKVFFGKKRASVRVESGEWSDRFALDAAGSTGVVECKANDMTYEIAVHNTLTHNSLTKQIMFIPMYVMMNKAPFTIEVQEDRRPGDPWIVVEQDQCVPLWPKTDSSKLLRVKSKGDMNLSSPFRFNEVQCCLLRFNNKYGGINVDVQVTEGGTYITFMEYHAGDAPALIINHTEHEISFWEKGNVNKRTLNPNQKMLYTWADPAGDRIILWNDGDKQVENDLRRDGVAQFQSTDNRTSCWVSFLDGTQRVLLFTKDFGIAAEAHSASRLDKVTQEIEVDIQGIGLSLVNNLKQCDIMYIGIASSGVIWEEKKKSKYFKQMKIQEVLMMESNYQDYLRYKQVGADANKLYHLDAANKIRIDFDAMILHKSSPREIRRMFYPGMWIQMKSSPYQKQIHAKINRIQIDNQLADCIFPVVLAPVPPPKSVAATTALKPFVECSIVERIIPHSDVKQFKYLTMLIQEFHVKVDLVFINEIVEMVSTELTDEESRKKFADDIQRQKEPLSALVLTHSSQEQKNFYDQLHLGPLKIHISFSMAGLEPGALPGVLSTILQGVGVTLTDINDIVFRLSFFEREYTFFTQRQLTSEIVNHYAGQALKQAYVLILGLDVIGNPYGLVVGLTKGVEDLFYEPFQGAIQGPGEFAEGLVLGMRSLFGHTVGGAAGAVSKITGAMGKGLAALTFDKEYQKKRREQLNKKPANLQEGLARSGKGLIMGVVDGVTGVFTKPISGAKSDGFEGFFKGLGQGAVGLVARPTAGIVDFASGSFDAVKRAAEMSEDVNRLRAPRFLHSDGILRPYCVREAEGNKILKEIEKGKYANSDLFAHYEVIIEKHDVLLLTDHRIMYCVKNDIFGGWQVDWTYRWTEIRTIKAVELGVQIDFDSSTSETRKSHTYHGWIKTKKRLI